MYSYANNCNRLNYLLKMIRAILIEYGRKKKEIYTNIYKFLGKNNLGAATVVMLP